MMAKKLKRNNPKANPEPVVVIGSDHAGYKTKQGLLKFLAGKGYTVVDVGGFDPDAHDDYPDYAAEVAKLVAEDKAARGILICGSGTGMVIAANKVPGIRASVVYDEYSAKMARHDNDANVMALRARNFNTAKEPRLVKIFLETPFSNLPRHKRRIAKIATLERKR
jgi:ribose 5-phosphate isomerase B